jgi:O-antigen ligase
MMPIQRLINRDFFGYNILEYTLFLSILTLLLGYNLNSQAVISFCIAGAFRNDWKDKKQRLSKNYMWVLSILLFFVFVSTLIWDPNGINALKSIEKRASFLIIPIIIASVPPFKKQILKTGFFVFVISVLMVCLSCIIMSGREYLITGDYRVFFYQYLSKQMDLNAIYLSLYCTFCLCVLMYYYFINPDPFKFISKPLAITLYITLLVFIILLSSKMMIFLSIVLTILSILYVAYKRGRLIAGLLLIAFIICAGGLIIWNTHYVRWRIQVTLVKKYHNQNDDQNGLAVRQKLWETSMKLIKERPLLGYGVMHANERLVQEYRRDNFIIAAENKYNSHSVYLQILLNGGVLAFMPLFMLLLTSSIIAIRRRSYLFLTFLFITILLGITEALFEGQKGIVFFVLFLFLFIYHFVPQNSESRI